MFVFRYLNCSSYNEQCHWVWPGKCQSTMLSFAPRRTWLDLLNSQHSTTYKNTKTDIIVQVMYKVFKIWLWKSDFKSLGFIISKSLVLMEFFRTSENKDCTNMKPTHNNLLEITINFCCCCCYSRDKVPHGWNCTLQMSIFLP